MLPALCFSNFSHRILFLCPGQSESWFSYFFFLCSWNDRGIQPCPAFYWLRWGLLPRLTSNHNQVSRIMHISHWSRYFKLLLHNLNLYFLYLFIILKMYFLCKYWSPFLLFLLKRINSSTRTRNIN
jgi:hypothetical protein